MLTVCVADDHGYPLQNGAEFVAHDSQQPLSSPHRHGLAATSWPAQVLGGNNVDNQSGDDFIDNWWVAGGIDWLNNLPENFDQREILGAQM